MSTPAPGPAPPRILVVDDEPAVRNTLAGGLEYEGYQVVTAADGRQALAALAREAPDLVLLDVMMPGMDGLTACRRLRATGSTVPVLMLTARGMVGDRVTGLDAGADDYLAKPFDLDELLARVRALLRRRAMAAARPPQEVLEFADLTMNVPTREVTRAGSPLALTRTEFSLLELLLRHPRQVLSRELILQEVWGFTYEPPTSSLHVYVMYLRRKTEAAGDPRLIHTVRGVGYVLREREPG
ncbi:DNA-binding response regulator [Actinomadura craniellae]|uniref:DNA-binding response regulator n=1 Tax=Actinomadura craniellae TaxID=2231787 RepID=A0A365H9J6_9ACTN|nr:response regulator transcription factor [Actinomadura craniellae]RAY14953.1 DNA-binding response regulator [Actinomadura craniellae]